MKPHIVIVGLGNPGAQYARTRHNVGYVVVDALSQTLEAAEWKDMQKFDALGCESSIESTNVLLLKPTTFMNLSGNAVRKVMDFYSLDPSKQLLVVTDDIDIPLGEVRFRKKGGPGTHNGLKSICDIYNENYARLRIGIGSPQRGEDLATWVLSIPSPEEGTILQECLQTVPEKIREFITQVATEL